MKYIAIAYDDQKKSVEIVVIKDARNLVEAQLCMKKLIASSHQNLRPGTIYGVNTITMVDPICSISMEDLESGKSVFVNEKDIAS